MIIPLGLGQKLYKPPIATLAIVLLTVLGYFQQPDFKSLYEKIAELRHDLQLKAKAVTFFRSYCQARIEPAELCDDYASLVASLYAEKKPLETDTENPREVRRYLRALEVERMLLDKLLQAKKGQRSYRMSQVLKSFYAFRHNPTKRLEKLAGYEPYKNALDDFSKRVAVEQQRFGVLSRFNFNLASLASAQVSHAGLFHLLSNLMMLVVFGCYVEQRLRRSIFVALYALGGTLALALQVACFKDPALILIGASANVSVILGLFYSLFYHSSLRLYVPFFSGAHPIYAPVKWSLPLMFVLPDFIAALTRVNYLVSSGNVAHLAHLFGFSAGVLVGFLLTYLKPLPAAFFYDDEYAAFKELLASRQLDQRLAMASTLLSYNSENESVRMAGVLSFSEAADDKALTPERLSFLREHLARAFAKARDEKSGDAYGRLFILLTQLPAELDLATVLGQCGQENLLFLADYALAMRHYHLSLSLYDCYLRAYPDTSEAPAVRHSIESLQAFVLTQQQAFAEAAPYARAA